MLEDRYARSPAHKPIIFLAYNRAVSWGFSWSRMLSSSTKIHIPFAGLPMAAKPSNPLHPQNDSAIWVQMIAQKQHNQDAKLLTQIVLLPILVPPSHAWSNTVPHLKIMYKAFLTLNATLPNQMNQSLLCLVCWQKSKIAHSLSPWPAIKKILSLKACPLPGMATSKKHTNGQGYNIHARLLQQKKMNTIVPERHHQLQPIEMKTVPNDLYP